MAMSDRWADKQKKKKKKKKKKKNRKSKIIGGAIAPPPPRGAAHCFPLSYKESQNEWTMQYGNGPVAAAQKRC